MSSVYDFLFQRDLAMNGAVTIHQVYQIAIITNRNPYCREVINPAYKNNRHLNSAPPVGLMNDNALNQDSGIYRSRLSP